MKEYMERIERANSMEELNRIVEEAAFDESLTNTQYERIALYAMEHV